MPLDIPLSLLAPAAPRSRALLAAGWITAGLAKPHDPVLAHAEKRVRLATAQAERLCTRGIEPILAMAELAAWQPIVARLRAKNA